MDWLNINTVNHMRWLIPKKYQNPNTNMLDRRQNSLKNIEAELEWGMLNAEWFMTKLCSVWNYHIFTTWQFGNSSDPKLATFAFKLEKTDL